MRRLDAPALPDASDGCTCPVAAAITGHSTPARLGACCGARRASGRSVRIIARFTARIARRLDTGPRLRDTFVQGADKSTAPSKDQTPHWS